MARKTLKSTFKDQDEKFQRTAFRLNQERSDFLLPQVLEFVKAKRWINLHPEYQRRLVWDVKKRSLFIESLLLNIPIPPLFLFERELSKYEVMDGQQRLNSIIDFFENKFSLRGLEIWHELNGLKFSDISETLKLGLYRRRVSATVLLVGASPQADNSEYDIRKLVFERLNTGGQELNAQELRNCLHSGLFNDLLIDASRGQLFCQLWGIPNYSENVDSAGNVSTLLSENRLYKRMGDCEIVLRFFAFRNKAKIKGSVKSMLDNCMEENENIDPAKAAILLREYEERLLFAHKIFGTRAFQYRAKKEKYRHSPPLSDAVLVGIDRAWEHRNDLVRAKRKIESGLNDILADEDAYAVIVGRPNTATAIHKRIDMFERLLLSSIGLN